MSTGHYHRRWSAGSSGGRNTPTSSSLTTSIEPSTYGTSWNSVRWNKPTSSYRSQSSITSRFEPKPSYTSTASTRLPISSVRINVTSPTSHVSEAVRGAVNVASLGPSVSSRASRFDSTVSSKQDKYRSEARELLNKWTSRERNGAESTYGRRADSSWQTKDRASAADNSYSSHRKENLAATSYLGSTAARSADPYPYRTTSMTPSRTSRFSIERSSMKSPSPAPQTHTLRQERPWRQRMAESSRIRAVHGDDFANRHSRESSVYGPSSKFTNTPSFATSYTKKEEDKPVASKYMSRSYSPIRSPGSLFQESTSNSSRLAPPSTMASGASTSQTGVFTRNSSQESVRDESRDRPPVSSVPKNPTIRESSREREVEKKLMKSKDRTARRTSRQRSLNVEESSSSEDDVPDREEARKKRREKRKDSANGLTPSASLSLIRSINSSSLYETGQDISERTSTAPFSPSAINGKPSPLTRQMTLDSDDFRSALGSPGPLSPQMGQKISRSNSKTRLPSKSQIIKSPSFVEVPGISKSESQSKMSEMDLSKATDNIMSNSMDNIDELLREYDYEEVSQADSSIQDDDSQHNAVAHFIKQPKLKVKPIAPVPGIWSRPGGEEHISKNKTLHREGQNLTTFTIWKIKSHDAVSKKVKLPKIVVAKPKSAEVKKTEPTPSTPVTAPPQKIDESSPVKKLVMTKKPKLIKEDSVDEKATKPEVKKEAKVEATKDAKKEVKPVEPAVPKSTPAVSKVAEVKKVTQNGAKKVEEAVPKQPEAKKVVEKVKKAEPEKPVEFKKTEEKKPEGKTAVPQKKPEPAKPVEVKKPEEIKPVVKKVEPVKKPEVKKEPPVVTAQCSVVFKAKPRPVEKCVSTQKEKRRVTVVKEGKLKAIPKPAEALVAKTLTKKADPQRTIKTLRPKSKIISSCSLTCLPTTLKTVHMDKELCARQEIFGAQVIVDTPEMGVNLEKAKLKVKRERKSMPCLSELQNQMAQQEAAQAALPIEDPDRSVSRDSTRASDLLDEMRGTEPALEWKREDDPTRLVLPDRSILEDYVRRKRGRLERLHSEPIQEVSSGCTSPTYSTTSELIPPCAVRVYENSPRSQQPYFTAPSRSRLGSQDTIESSSTPTRMLDAVAPVQFNNFNSTPQAFMRSNARLQCAKPIQFEAPQTPFEERLQMQANAIRKANVLNVQEPAVNRDASPRRVSIDGMSSISSTFTNAVAEKAGHARHERYAAHIPVNRQESGRQSSASVNSTESGILDTATKQLDQVIDQARHRHHQHRNKFKEAIDYLDQIFEDLKKECDTTNGEDRNNNCDAEQTNGRNSSHSVRKEKEPRKATVYPSSSKTNSLPNRSQRNQPNNKAASPVELVVPTKLIEPNLSSDVAVTETIVLPKKTDKLDFTRRWLQDDLSSLAHQQPSPVLLIGEQNQYTDADEHSLGSCSAEVAAINASSKTKQKKTPSKPIIGQPQPQPVPIRPQAHRPNPVYQSVPGSSGVRQFPLDSDNAGGLQRVASFDQVGDRRENYWRSGSQEPYHTLSSVRSDADCRPSPSAFQNVSNFSRGGMRASLRSLPDASIVKNGNRSGDYYSQSRGNGQPATDPSLAIEALVAELALNTEPADKRRSFPTSLRSDESARMQRFAPQQQPQQAHRRPVQQSNSNGYHAPPPSQQHQQPLNGHHRLQQPQFSQAPQRPNYHPPQQMVAPQPRSSSNSRPQPQNAQKSLDDVANMLNTVVNDFGQAQKKKHSGQLYPSMHNPPQSNPFETINQERINPSRVEAMHNMFEQKHSVPRPQQHNQNAWRNHAPQPFRREEENLYEMADTAIVRPYKRVSPPRQIHSSVVRRQSPMNSSGEFTPAYPSTQPPQHPPGRNGSATSSTHGGYYSSNSSTAGPATHTQQAGQRGSIIGRQSLSSRAPSVDDEDDGFYDNIGIYDDRRYSRGSELDVASISSRQLPPKQQGKIGSFFRKIGGGGGRPPQAAASLVSLNKAPNETPMRSGVLMKSNSLSNEPWAQQVLKQEQREASASKGSFGSRLKNSLFGSKKRLDG